MALDKVYTTLVHIVGGWLVVFRVTVRISFVCLRVMGVMGVVVVVVDATLLLLSEGRYLYNQSSE